MHPRCMNCHPAGDQPLQGDDSHIHTQNVQRGKDGKGKYALKCANCHQEKNVAGENMPPGNPAYSTPLKVFLCPSSSGQPTIDYSAELVNSFGNFNVAVSYPPGLIFGRSDYAPDAGMSADIPGININAGASIIAQPPTPAVRITDITDGSSNTLMIVEDAGRPGWYSSKGLVTSGPARSGWPVSTHGAARCRRRVRQRRKACRLCCRLCRAAAWKR